MELLRSTDKTAFDTFVKSQPHIHYSKLWFWGQFESLHGYQAQYWRFVDLGKTVATAICLQKSTIFGKLWYIPNGPSLSIEQPNLLEEVLDLIKRNAVKFNILSVRIDTNIPRNHHDNQGNLIEDGFSNESITQRFENTGFKHTGYNYGYSGYLFSRFTYVLDLEGDTGSLVDKIAPNVRNLYKKNLRRGVIVRNGTRDDLVYLARFGIELSKKLYFKPKSLKFFQQLYDLAAENVLYRVAIADLNVAKQTIAKERETLLIAYDKAKDNPRKAGFLKETQRQLDDLEREENDLNQLIKQHGDTLILGASLYLIAGDRSYNVYTYTNKDFPSFHATISLHVDSYEELKERGVRYYDFVGVSGSLDPKDPYYGLHDFKRKFGGDFVENLGEFYFKPRPKMAHIQFRSYVYQRKFERKFNETWIKFKNKVQTKK